nr:PREDICTED: olfactory receptor 4S2-like [Bos mutus]
MGHENVTEFILLGLFIDENGELACFMLFLLCYIVILSGNLLILLTIRGSHLSEQPMHFFLSYSTLMGACFTSTVAPTLITDLLVQQKTISYNSCAAQMFYAHFFGATEIFILVAMAYDCYVAICRPLHYMVIMNRQVYYVLDSLIKGHCKALSTCGSHITMVFMFFLSLIFTYAPTADYVRNHKVFALFYTIIAPMFNPFIYTLRNTDMKNAMRKV